MGGRKLIKERSLGSDARASRHGDYLRRSSPDRRWDHEDNGATGVRLFQRVPTPSYTTTRNAPKTPGLGAAARTIGRRATSSAR